MSSYDESYIDRAAETFSQELYNDPYGQSEKQYEDSQDKPSSYMPPEEPATTCLTKEERLEAYNKTIQSLEDMSMETTNTKDDSHLRRDLMLVPTESFPFLKSLQVFQKEVTYSVKNKQGHHGTYSDVNGVLETIRKPLADNNLVIRFQFSATGEEDPILCLLVSHTETGFTETSSKILRGYNKLKEQEKGGVETYQKRYLLMSYFCLPGAEVDHDGGEPLPPLVCVIQDTLTANFEEKEANKRWLGYAKSTKNFTDTTKAKAILIDLLTKEVGAKK